MATSIRSQGDVTMSLYEYASHQHLWTASISIFQRSFNASKNPLIYAQNNSPPISAIGRSDTPQLVEQNGSLAADRARLFNRGRISRAANLFLFFFFLLLSPDRDRGRGRKEGSFTPPDYAYTQTRLDNAIA